MDRVVIPIFYFLIIWQMKPAPIIWQYLEISFLDCQSANQASQMNGVFIHQFKLEKLKLIAYQTRIHEPLNTTWSWNEDFSKLPATMIYRWYVRVTDIIFLMTIFGIGCTKFRSWWHISYVSSRQCLSDGPYHMDNSVTNFYGRQQSSPTSM